MKLWEKNYLLTYAFFLFVLSLGISAFLITSFQNDINQGRKDAIREQKSIIYSLGILSREDMWETRVKEFAQMYKKYGVLMGVMTEGSMVAETLPQEVSLGKWGSVTIVTVEKEKYFSIFDNISVAGKKSDYIYLKKIDDIYRSQRQRIIAALLIGLLMSGICGAILYFSMKRIYKPIHNISHELRTPLTTIQGYAQYLQVGKLTEEERFYATEQMVEETEHLKNIVEKILVMGNIKEGEIRKETIDLTPVFAKMKEKYPVLDVECGACDIQGDETLVNSLFDNLISNAAREGSCVKVKAEKGKVTIWNDGPSIPSYKLKKLNKNIPLDKNEVAGNGYGVRLCHDIVKLHKGKLHYQSDKENGTTVMVEF